MFGRAIEREIGAASDNRRDWEYGISLGHGETMTGTEFMTFASRKDSEATRTVSLVEELLRQSIPKAFGPRGDAGDPDEILYVASRLGTVYRQMLEWKLAFLRVTIPPALNDLRLVQSRLCDQVVRDIEEFCGTFIARVTEAIQSAKAGQVVDMSLKLNFTPPNIALVHEELAKLKHRIDSGQIEWD